ncbi:MAG: hypothetical protein HY701_02590 [Gemmatimonadetes bacterium]|nr:hypothetical protein [Gemmatimonadota bacterium]
MAGAWVLLQAMDIFADQFAFPVGLVRAFTVLLGAGFLAALIVAWYHGERGAQSVSAVEILMLASLATAAGGILFLIAQPARNDPAPPSPVVLRDRNVWARVSAALRRVHAAVAGS